MLFGAMPERMCVAGSVLKLEKGRIRPSPLLKQWDICLLSLASMRKKQQMIMFVQALLHVPSVYVLVAAFLHTPGVME